MNFRWARWFTVGSRNELGYATQKIPTLWHVSDDGAHTICGDAINGEAQYELDDAEPIIGDPIPLIDFPDDPPDREVRACKRCLLTLAACKAGEALRQRREGIR